MTDDIKSYIRNAVDAEDRVQDMKNQMNYMGSVVYQDALTQVKNKAWYEKTKERVDKEIKNGRARFAIVMVDLNQLKVVNDTYGHERGDEYIFGSCHQICGVYVHSSVCRIGGDEFVVLLENSDYDNRAFLLDRLKTAFEESSTDVTRHPWERYSAAVGMAVYVRSDDGSIDEVFRRADSQMYEDKQRQKAERR
jgi:diguanylate cyclase (GGDEF)-like protein